MPTCHKAGEGRGDGAIGRIRHLRIAEAGIGQHAQIPGVKVAGKTGSAETGGTNVNSMFVGFAPYDSPTVAISVALEDYDKHDVKAAKIAGIVLTAALAAQGA